MMRVIALLNCCVASVFAHGAHSSSLAARVAPGSQCVTLGCALCLIKFCIPCNVRVLRSANSSCCVFRTSNSESPRAQCVSSRFFCVLPAWPRRKRETIKSALYYLSCLCLACSTTIANVVTTRICIFIVSNVCCTLGSQLPIPFMYGPLAVVGHPKGLSVKYADNGYVVGDRRYYFQGEWTSLADKGERFCMSQYCAELRMVSVLYLALYLSGTDVLLPDSYFQRKLHIRTQGELLR